MRRLFLSNKNNDKAVCFERSAAIPEAPSYTVGLACLAETTVTYKKDEDAHERKNCNVM